MSGGESSNFGPGGSDIKNRMEEMKNRGEEAATGLMEKARETASEAYKQAGQAVSAVGEKAESAASAVGGRMTSLAGTIREKMPHEGMLGTASESVASTLESGGRYLEVEGFSGMLDDVGNLIRRNPLPAFFIGIGIGFFLARTVRS
jgi:hypothetical protein